MIKKILFFVGLVIVILICGFYWLLLDARHGTKSRFVANDFEFILISIAAEMNATHTHTQCRSIATPDPQNVCNSIVRTEDLTVAGSQCGADADVHFTDILANEFSAIALYDFSAFDRIVEIGFLDAASSVEDLNQVNRVSFERLEERVSDLRVSYHSCSNGNFLKIEGRYE